MKQIKLTTKERQSAEESAKALLTICEWEKTPEGHDYWDEVHSKLFNTAKHGTTDGKPWVEPELTDEDAKQRPWVMVRDDEAHGWHGPRILAARCSSNYYSFTPSKSAIVGFRYCRRATPEEIEAANG